MRSRGPLTMVVVLIAAIAFVAWRGVSAPHWDCVETAREATLRVEIKYDSTDVLLDMGSVTVSWDGGAAAIAGDSTWAGWSGRTITVDHARALAVEAARLLSAPPHINPDSVPSAVTSVDLDCDGTRSHTELRAHSADHRFALSACFGKGSNRHLVDCVHGWFKTRREGLHVDDRAADLTQYVWAVRVAHP